MAIIITPEIQNRFSNQKKKIRKQGVNRNKKGSVRNINGKLYVDFYYLGERIRESSGLSWNKKNMEIVRKQMDRIYSAIELGTFRYAEVFPQSKKRDYFSEKEQKQMGIDLQPDQVSCDDFIQEWFELLKNSGRVTERTLFGYYEYVKNYLLPYFGSLTFNELNLVVFDKFFSWARKQKYRGRVVSNATLNKCITILKIVCKYAAQHHQWGNNFHPFLGYKKLPTEDPYEKIHPFSILEQKRLIEALPSNWKPYFKLAFSTGLRQGEQIALKPDDIDWENKVLHIRRAMTLDINGKPVEGKTKNKYSRRSLHLLPVMLETLMEQNLIIKHLRNVEYFFCTPTGARIDASNLRRNVWIPALQKSGLDIREMKQTRHSFATNAISCGENPLWIAKVLGHRNTEMIIKVYSKYVEKSGVSNDGNAFNDLY